MRAVVRVTPWGSGRFRALVSVDGGPEREVAVSGEARREPVAAAEDVVQTLVGDDPVRLEVTFAAGGGGLVVTVEVAGVEGEGGGGGAAVR